ncbi:hypothetical protein GY45DRAFT_1366378 [Cubamyces sp. BRFM 1775]|nr:hypothetical protein GY45DRAFT_1366378 [Cubamyces sp. BRFM 1775]
MTRSRFYCGRHLEPESCRTTGTIQPWNTSAVLTATVLLRPPRLNRDCPTVRYWQSLHPSRLRRGCCCEKQTPRRDPSGPFTATLSDPALPRFSVSRKQMGSIYGGSLMRICTQSSGRNFLYPGIDMNPFLPRQAKRPALLIRSYDDARWMDGVQTVFNAGVCPGE